MVCFAPGQVQKISIASSHRWLSANDLRAEKLTYKSSKIITLNQCTYKKMV